MQKTYFRISYACLFTLKYILSGRVESQLWHMKSGRLTRIEPGPQRGRPWRWSPGLLGKSLPPVFKTLFQTIVCYPRFLATIIEKHLYYVL